MSDDLVYAIFKELAVLEGKRSVTGEWSSADSKDVNRLLKMAFTVVRRAADPGERRPKGGKDDGDSGEE